MTHFLGWLRFVARLTLLYALAGLCGAAAACLAITLYAEPHYIWPFTAGVGIRSLKRLIVPATEALFTGDGVRNFLAGLHSTLPDAPSRGLRHPTI